MRQLMIVTLIGLSLGSPSIAQSWEWETIDTIGGPTARHEAALVTHQDKVYLIGGRRINPVEVFDPTSNTWTKLSVTPLELHHFQAVSVDDAIYLIGAMTGVWPNETPLGKIVVYYPTRDEFAFVHSIPESRRRGGAGAAVYNGKLYIVGGITNGHMDGYQPWLDEYDPDTGRWTVLPDAPHARDHFQAVVHDDKLFAIAGRTTSQRTDQGFDLTVKHVDVYDFQRGKWLANDDCPNLPTPRAGNMAMAWGDEIVVGGGESGTQQTAHNQVEAYDVQQRSWRNWPSLVRGRHGTGFAVVGEYVYTVSGSGDRGGGPELITTERLRLPADRAPRASSKCHAGGHTVTLAFTGPTTSESDSINPFTDYRLRVTLKHFDSEMPDSEMPDSEMPDSEMTVRGYYAADGHAAQTGAAAGNVWQAKFASLLAGKWTYQAELRWGDNIAISDDPAAGTRVDLANATGEFQITKSSHSSEELSIDFRNRGRVIADGRYFRFADQGRHWLKGGADSPENLLAYADFDGTVRRSASEREGEASVSSELHRYAAHEKDWLSGDPTWRNQKGKGLIGAINYLSSVGMNAVYFLTLNIGGDGDDVWPYADPSDVTRFDCSKLDQWELVFEHMQRRGIMMHIVTQETENERLLDGGDTGVTRQLYYRELIARFAHHPALVWNLGEENGPASFSPIGQNAQQQKAMATYLRRSDPYHHPVVIHTHSTADGKEDILPALLGHPDLDGLSFQVDEPKRVHQETIEWLRRSAESNQPWLICMDEIGKWHTGVLPDSEDPRHDELRRHVLWGSLLAGAAGVEWYFGAHYPGNDLTCEDWRQRENIWHQTRHALQFFERHLPYAKMTPRDDLTSREDDYCFAWRGKAYAIYVPQMTASDGRRLNLEDFDAPMAVRWYDPRLGGELQLGQVTSVTGPGLTPLGAPPQHAETQDWVILIKQQ